MRRGGGPGRKTNHRIIVENLSSRTSWQVSNALWMTGKINLSVFILTKYTDRVITPTIWIHHLKYNTPDSQ